MKTQLTDLSIRALKSDCAQLDCWDTKTPGFGIRVGKNTKTFMVKVDNRRINLGTYPDLSLVEARKKALGHKSAGAPANSSAPLFKDALELFLKTHCEARNRPSTRKETERILRRHLLPKFGEKTLDKITHEQFAEIIDGLLDTPSEANHAFKAARTFLRWATKPPRKYIAVSPIQGMEMPTREVRRKRVLSEAELVKVWRAAEQMGHPYGTIVQLLILLGQRRGETGALQWPWINEKEQTITFPPEATKNGLEHTLPYDGSVAKILEQIPRLNTTQLLFPSEKGTAFSGWSKSKVAFDKISGVTGYTLHDLRRTFRTMHGKIGTLREIAERLVNHITGAGTDVELVYDQYKYLPQMRSAMTRWDEHLSTLLLRP
jgi:integrase